MNGKSTHKNDAYADDTPLTHVFGANARVKILSAMLSEREHDLNVTDIANMAGVARSTVYDHLEELREMHLVVQTREVGGAPMYQINNDNEIVTRIDEIEGLALRELVDVE
jgi:DNA-binding transcriptional ArsR family regulator